MLKKYLVAIMAFFAISFVFISCSNDDDDNTEVTTTSKNVYSIDADLSCYITAMGGQEFGKPVYKLFRKR